MFFSVSKVVWFFTSPTNLLLIVLLIASALLFTRFAGLARVPVLLVTVILLVAGLTPFSRLLIQTLENRYPDISTDPGRVDGVVVLGGASTFARGQVRLGEGGSRMTAAIDLARRYPDARVVFTGGSARLLMREERTEADGARLIFDLAGLPPDRVLYENQSRNTYENAVYAKRLVTPQPGERWLLVTSAFHMPRSVATFQRAGFKVVPYPVDYRSDGAFPDDYRLFATAPEGLRLFDITVREWIGLFVYWLQGYAGSKPE